MARIEKIIIVTTDPDIIVRVSDALSNQGYVTEPCKTVDELSALIEAVDPRPLVVLDMPEDCQEGMQLLTRLTRLKEMPPLLALVPEKSAELSLACIEAGARAYLLKNDGLEKFLPIMVREIADRRLETAESQRIGPASPLKRPRQADYQEKADVKTGISGHERERFLLPDRLNILLVDDDAFVRDMIRFILEAEGYTIHTAENGALGLQKYHETPHLHLVISDMDMPGMNGLELINALRDEGMDIPIIILTGNDAISIALEAMNKGASDYLLKDENIQETISPAVRKVIEKHFLEKRVDSLLKNTLPTIVAEEMKYKGAFAPRRYHCTILFSDFVQFTKLAETISDEDLIWLLDELFMGFDDLINHFSGTKIKTIGDSYMAVFGAPERLDNHARLGVQAGISLLEFVKDFNSAHHQKFRMRIGIHTGTVMAGVVGLERMQFDVFGDQVNIAARFESSGEAGKINISEETYSLIRDDFIFEERGYIPLKNKSDMRAYFVSGERKGL